MKSVQKRDLDLGQALVDAFLTNERVNQVLLDLWDPAIWNAQPPCSKRRNIATTFAHIHNVRCMRLKMSAKGRKLPARLDRARVTPDQARKALAESAAAYAAFIRSALEDGGRVAGFKPGIVTLVCGAVIHEAHHRGQVCHWARELGAPITPEMQLQLWEWDKRWKEVTGQHYDHT